jgi:hypothetical protein
MVRQDRGEIKLLHEAVSIVDLYSSSFDGFDHRCTPSKISRDILRMNLLYLTSRINKLLVNPDVT